jgi:hypothetical protein
METHGQRNNAVLRTNVWPGSYSRDHCHIAKLISNWREQTNHGPSVISRKLALASLHSRQDKHSGMIKPQYKKSNTKICVLPYI